MVKKNNPDILVVNLETNVEEIRKMTDEEFVEYTSALEDAKVALDKHNQDVLKKEAAIGKLVALGLTEEDIRVMGL